MLNKKFLIIALVAACTLVMVAGYNRPYHWWPVNDMTEQEYIKSFTEGSGRAPAAGTVSVNEWDTVPMTMEVLANNGEHDGIVRPDAWPTTPESIKKGEILYFSYCQHCHGQEMSVDPAKFSPVKKGTMEGKYALLAPGMERLAASPPYTDKYIFATITNGSASGLMKRMSYHLSPEERWEVVDYVRSLVDKYNQDHK